MPVIYSIVLVHISAGVVRNIFDLHTSIYMETKLLRFVQDVAHYGSIAILLYNRSAIRMMIRISSDLTKHAMYLSDVALSTSQLERVYLHEVGQDPEVLRKVYGHKSSSYANNGSETGYSEHHENFGLIFFSRVSGHRKFFRSIVNH